MRQFISVVIILAMTTNLMGQVRWKEEQEENKKRRIETFMKWIREKGITFKQLPKADPKELVYDCDSVPIIKQIRGDTLIYWIKSQWSVTGGIYLDHDIEELNKQISKKSFGLTDYVDRLDDLGNVVLVSLLPKKFKIQNDSLFALTSYSRIPLDTIEKAIKDGKFELAQKLFKQGVYHRFELIFHPEMFRVNKIYERKSHDDYITLDHVWLIGERKYYEISFNRDSYGTLIKFPTYLFDDKYRFIRYDGCNRSETDQLTKEKEIWK